MIAGILAFFGIVGIPAIVVGIIGKLGLLAGFLGGGSVIAGLLAPLIQLCIALIDLLAIVARWILKTVLKGLDHIIKSPAAVIAVFVFMWGAYAYAKVTTYVEHPRAKPRHERVKPPERKPKRRSWFFRKSEPVKVKEAERIEYHSPKPEKSDWRRKVWGY